MVSSNRRQWSNDASATHWDFFAFSHHVAFLFQALSREHTCAIQVFVEGAVLSLLAIITLSDICVVKHSITSCATVVVVSCSPVQTLRLILNNGCIYPRAKLSAINYLTTCHGVHPRLAFWPGRAEIQQ